MIDFDRNFPRYTDYPSEVPVWCLTPETPGVIHRFFDTSPISPSGRYLAGFQLPPHDDFPRPGDRAKVVVTDLETGEEKTVWASIQDYLQVLGCSILTTLPFLLLLKYTGAGPLW